MVQPSNMVQSININGQETLFIPTNLTNIGGQYLQSGQVVRPSGVLPAGLLQTQTIQLPNG